MGPAEGKERGWEIAHGPWLHCRGTGRWNRAGGVGFPSETFHNTSPRAGQAHAATLGSPANPPSPAEPGGDVPGESSTRTVPVQQGGFGLAAAESLAD